jgi:hypothetical protein
MHRCPGLRLALGKHGLEHPIPEHALARELWEQRRMGV